MISGAPQVLRRGDNYVVSNVDLESLTPRERVTLAVQIYEQVKYLTQMNGEKFDAREIRALSANLAGAAHTTARRVGEMTSRNPELLDLWIEGMGLNDLLRAGGYSVKSRLDEGKEPKNKTLGNFGTSDKFGVASEVWFKYLKAWEKRDFKYTHINPAEARRRLKRLTEIRELTNQAIEDIEMRSHSATHSAPPEKKRRENGV